MVNPLTGAVIDKIEAKNGATLVGDKTTPSGLVIGRYIEAHEFFMSKVEHVRA